MFLLDQPAAKEAPPMALLAHWYKLIEKLQESPLEFYHNVEEAIEERRIPGLEVTRVERREGGLLSAKRLYLRLIRERNGL